MFDKQFVAPVPAPGEILVTIDKIPIDDDVMPKSIQSLIF
jgi:hypothetical protein